MTSRRRYRGAAGLLPALVLLLALPGVAGAQAPIFSFQATPSPFGPGTPISLSASVSLQNQVEWWCGYAPPNYCVPLSVTASIQITGTNGYAASTQAWEPWATLQTADPGPGQTLQGVTYTATGVVVVTYCQWDIFAGACGSPPEDYVESGQIQRSVVPIPTPAISGLSPTIGTIGSAVTISGAHFTGTPGTVRFNGTTASTSAWTPASITATVPAGATSGPVTVTVGGQTSNGVAFAVKPNLTSLSPSAGPLGQSVTIQGTGFGGSQGGSSVRFNGTTASVTQWTGTSVTATVPGAATSGPVTVTVGGQASTGLTFTVVAAPQVSGVVPGSGVIGQTVQVTGAHFGATQGSSTVRFNGTLAPVFGWTNTSLTVQVPGGATSGPVVVTVNGVASNGWAFTIVAEQVSYYHTDAIGSVRMTTGPAGQVEARYDYQPFGQPWPSDSAPERRRFAGMERDLETGAGNWEALNYAGARYYSGLTGRFMAVDPVVLKKRSLVEPQRWNRYTYGLSNPLRYVDPDGRCAVAAGVDTAACVFVGTALAKAAIATLVASGTAALVWLGIKASEKADEDGEVSTDETNAGGGRSLDDILDDSGLFNRWIRHRHPADRPRSVEEARQIWDRLVAEGLRPRLDQGHPGTQWTGPHINVEGTSIHIPVDPNFVP